MLTVRYPNGQAVQYNRAWFVKYHDYAWCIYDKSPDKGGSLQLVIQPSAGAIVEWVPPCRVYNALSEQSIQSFANMGKELRSIKRKLAGTKGKRKSSTR